MAVKQALQSQMQLLEARQLMSESNVVQRTKQMTEKQDPIAAYRAIAEYESH